VSLVEQEQQQGHHRSTSQVHERLYIKFQALQEHIRIHMSRKNDMWTHTPLLGTQCMLTRGFLRGRSKTQVTLSRAVPAVPELQLAQKVHKDRGPPPKRRFHRTLHQINTQNIPRAEARAGNPRRTSLRTLSLRKTRTVAEALTDSPKSNLHHLYHWEPSKDSIHSARRFGQKVPKVDTACMRQRLSGCRH
jgi:hypothetical protein